MNNIRKIRCEKGIKQQELAQQIGVSAAMISRYERERVLPTEDTLLAIAAALGTSLDALVAENDSSEQVSAPVRQKKYSPIDYDKLKVSRVNDRLIEHSIRKQANGICELCGNPAPFANLDGEPYLETHYVKWISHGGEAIETNLVALCPNCHMRMHIVNSDDDNKKLEERAAMHKPVSCADTNTVK